MRVKTSNKKIHLVSALCLILLLGVLWVVVPRMEGVSPAVTLAPEPDFFGKRGEFSLTASDAGSGLRKIWVAVLKDDKETVLLDHMFPRPGLTGSGKVHDASFQIQFDPEKLNMSDGRAVLRTSVSDHSWRRWWRGNTAYREREVVIDTVPPQIDVLSRAHYINQGGTGLVIYRLSEACPKNGVLVGDRFFPGHSGWFKDAEVFTAFFGLAYDQGDETTLVITASDSAGNLAKKGFPYAISKKRFKEDTLSISDGFLSWKMPEFESQIPRESSDTLLDQFLWVNREMRRLNEQAIQNIGAQSASTPYWEGVFLRLPNAAQRAGFADQRNYMYNGRKVDRQVHMGIDLASVRHSPVPASNRGNVVFADQLGIYGKMVIIDHGFGLFSMYSHLNRIDVQTDQEVFKGDLIGLTGMTGFAGGDHLHFGMFVHQTYVNPIEWWDAAWIENNILNKLRAVKERLGE